jgi:conjugative relaxase-like TrwC/TraI family protein
MMSVSPGMAAASATSYFSREDYYLEGTELAGNSRWCGKGAEELGLSGPVREEEFRALCRGEELSGNVIVSPRVIRDKETGELVAMRRAGNDCTFSAPKSVSIAYAAGVKEMKEAHDAAVLSVLDHVEGHYSLYRSPEGFRQGGMVAAKFDHATSRNVDPQLHSHVFVVNAVRTGEGSWRANQPRAIFEDQKSLGLWYRQELAHELTKRGFEVAIQDRSQMYIELKGIDPRLVEHFSSRRQAIERQVEKWQAEGLFAGVPHARLYEMAALESRDPKRAISKEEVERTFERGFEECGSSFAAVRKDLEKGRQLELPLPHEASKALELAVRDLTGREALLKRAELLDQAVRISGGEHSLRELSAGIEAGTDGLLRLGQDARGREIYTTREMRELETRNLRRIGALPPFRSVAPRAEAEAFLERLAGEGVRLTAGQRSEFLHEVSGGKGLAASLGDPGTAKTSTLGFVERFNSEVLLPSGREHFSVNLAYTGKAARELSAATGRPAFTLASFQKGDPASKFAQQRANREPPMVEVGGEKVLIPEGAGKQLVLRVDEAGFLGARQAERLLGVVEELQRRGMQVKLHLLGDSKQMQGIEAGDILRQLQEPEVRKGIDYTHLTEILRQRDQGLLEIARELNREDRELSENARQALGLLEKRGELVEVADPAGLRAAAVEHYLEESRKPSPLPERTAVGEPQRVLLVTSTNAARRELNREIRAARVAAGEIAEGKAFAVLAPVRQGVTVEDYRLGDTLLFSGERDAEGRAVNWGARLHTEGRVTGLDREKNLVRIGYSFQARNGTVREVTREFPAAELSGRTTLLREEQRSFSVGDRIVLLKNDARLKVQNGSLGMVREIDDAGRMRVDLEGREVLLDLKSYRQIDHGYAVTIHKSQGATVDHSIMYAPVRPERGPGGPGFEEGYGRTSYNALNVAVTRARFGTRVFTNSVEGLTRSVQLVDGKTSTLDRSVLEPAARPLPQPKGELTRCIENLERSVHHPEGEAKLPSLERVLPELRAPGRHLPLPAAPLQKDIGRELQRVLPHKGVEIELEK